MGGITFSDAADVQIGQMIVVVYGNPNTGKTSLSFTTKAPVMLDFDGGVYRAGNKAGKPVLQVRDWSQIENLDASDLADYKTLIVDTVGTCLDILAMDIIKENPRHGRSGSLTLQGYGTLKARFKSWLALLKSFGLDVVLVAHQDEERRGDETVDRIVATGGSKQEVYQQADLMGRLYIEGTQRILTFDPTMASFGKNVGLADTVVPEPSLAPTVLGDLILQGRDLIDTYSKRQAAEHDRLTQLREVISGLSRPEDFTGMTKVMKETDAPAAERRILTEIATSRGYELDRQTMTWNPGKSPEAPPAVQDLAPVAATQPAPERKPAPEAPSEEYDRETFLRQRFEALKGAEIFNQEARMQIVTNMPMNERELLAVIAREKGLLYDEVQSLWYEAEQEMLI